MCSANRHSLVISTPSWAAIRQVELATLKGQFNPYTESGTIIVNGVVASSHSSWFLEEEHIGSMLGSGLGLDASSVPGVYQKLLSPVRALHSAAPRFVKAFCDKHVAEAPEQPLSALGVGDIVRSIASLALEKR